MSETVAQIGSDEIVEEFFENIVNPETNITKFYSEFGEKYDAFVEKRYSWNLKELFVNEFELLQPNKSSKILDIGCGTGLLGKELMKRGYNNIDGLDGSQKLEEICLKKGVTYKRFYEFCIQVDVDLPMEPATYDVVLGADVIYKDHISMEALEKILQVIKPGGLLGWSHNSWSEVSRNLPLAEDYKTLQTLIDKKLIEFIPEYFPKVVKSIPDTMEQRVWFVRKL